MRARTYTIHTALSHAHSWTPLNLFLDTKAAFASAGNPTHRTLLVSQSSSRNGPTPHMVSPRALQVEPVQRVTQEAHTPKDAHALHAWHVQGSTTAVCGSQLRCGPCGAGKYDRSLILGLRSAVVLRGAAAAASKREKRKAVAKSEAMR